MTETEKSEAELERLEYQERILIRSPGRHGYLSFPKAFKEKFDHDKEVLPEPDAYLAEVNGRVRLIFEWNRKDLDASRRKA